MSARVDELFRYPVKAATGEPLEEAPIAARGIARDRRWMVVEPDGTFLTQRSLPRLALLEPELSSGRLSLSFADPKADRLDEKRDGDRAKHTIDIPSPPETSEQMEVEIWGDRVSALRAGSAADGWLSERLGLECRLVYMPDSSRRALETDSTGSGAEIVSFVDGYPFLLIGRASLRALNERLETPLPMDRFRPNIVVEGTEPFAEDEWEQIRIGGVSFRVAAECTRCAVTTVDQQTGERGKEPLRTLADFRRTDDGEVVFGQYLVHESTGSIRRGDEVVVEE